MGILVIAAWVGSLAFLGMPGLVLGIIVCAKSQRTPAFWSSCVLTAAVSVAAQYAVVLAPSVRQGTYSWGLVIESVFGWHLLAPAVVALLLWIAGKAAERPTVAGTVAGLLASIPSGIALGLPMVVTVPPALGLRFQY